MVGRTSHQRARIKPHATYGKVTNEIVIGSGAPSGASVARSNLIYVQHLHLCRSEPVSDPAERIRTTDFVTLATILFLYLRIVLVILAVLMVWGLLIGISSVLPIDLGAQ